MSNSTDTIYVLGAHMQANGGALYQDLDEFFKVGILVHALQARGIDARQY